MNVALNGFTKPWEPFVKGICAQENIPYWQRLWNDCIEKKTREKFISNKQGGGDEGPHDGNRKSPINLQEKI